MRIGVIAAMEDELLPLVGAFSHREILSERPVRLRSGAIGTHQVCVVRSDPGKVNAALAAQHLIHVFSPEIIVNVGSSGALSRDLDIGDLVVGRILVQHDFDLTAFGLRPGELAFDLTLEGTSGNMSFNRKLEFETSEHFTSVLFSLAQRLAESGRLAKVNDRTPRVHTGTLVSGDQFIGSLEKCSALETTFGALATDMEAAALAHVAQQNEVPFVCLRAMSDRADHSAHVAFGDFLRSATENYGAVLREFFEKLAKDG